MKLYLLPLALGLFFSTLQAPKKKITHLCIDPSVLFEWSKDELYNSTWSDIGRSIVNFSMSLTLPSKQDIIDMLSQADNRYAASKYPIHSNDEKLPLLISDAFTKKNAKRNLERLFITGQSRERGTFIHKMCISVIDRIIDPERFARLYRPRPHALSLLQKIRSSFKGKIILYGNYPQEKGFETYFPELRELVDLSYLSGTVDMVKANPHFSNIQHFPEKTTICIETQIGHCNGPYTCEVIDPSKLKSILAVLAQYNICKDQPLIPPQNIRNNHFSIEKNKSKTDPHESAPKTKETEDEWTFINPEKITETQADSGYTLIERTQEVL